MTRSDTATRARASLILITDQSLGANGEIIYDHARARPNSSCRDQTSPN